MKFRKLIKMMKKGFNVEINNRSVSYSRYFKAYLIPSNEFLKMDFISRKLLKKAVKEYKISDIW